MRNWNHIIRSLSGAAALMTMVGCQGEVRTAERSAPVAITTTPPAMTHPDLGLPVVATVEPTIVDEDEVETTTKSLINDARAALTAGDLDRAFRLARLAVLKSPDQARTWNTLGRVQLRRGERAAAIESFAQAVEVDPASAWAQNNYGLALLYAERYDEAVAALEEATELSADTGLMWNNLGMAYEHLDRIEEARFAYKRAMALDHGPATQNFVRLEGVRTLVL